MDMVNCEISVMIKRLKQHMCPPTTTKTALEKSVRILRDEVEKLINENNKLQETMNDLQDKVYEYEEEEKREERDSRERRY